MTETGISSERRGRKERDWTQGSTARNLLSLTGPAMLSQSLNMIGPFIDMIWLGKLGAASVAGVGIASLAVMLVNATMRGLTTGMRALIARFVGAGNNEAANHVAKQSFYIGIGFSVVVAAIGMFFAEPILRAFGVEADVVSEGAAYMRIQLVGMITMSLRMFTEGTMQSSGDVVTPMKIGIIFRVFHAALCPFLIFGWWVFPQLGVSGAAATNLIAQSLGAILGLWILFSGRTRLQLTLKNLRFDLDIIWRMVKIGIPNTLMNIQQYLSLLTLVWLIAPFGTLAVAAHTLVERMDTIPLTLSLGIGVGAGILAGQNLGANQPERAVKGGWLAVGFAMIINVIGSVALLLWAEKMTHIFSTEPALVEITSTFLRISAAGYIARGLGSLFRQFLSGVGDTLPALLFELIPTWGVLIPLAFLFPRVTDFGVLGIRWLMVSRMAIGGIIFTLYFWMGKWKYKKV